MTNAATAENWVPLRFTARDGLSLHCRHYPAPRSARRPVVCVAGLTRNSRDFHALASALSAGPAARSVYALDLRGRGLSDHDPDWRNYVVPVEAYDVIDLITLAGLSGAHVIGTSRGGLIAMAMSVIQPGALTSVVLNDIGPVIEPSGLLRISSYVGRISSPKTWQEATQAVRKQAQRYFPDVPDADWELLARQWFNEENGRPVPGYDAKLARTFSVKDGKVPQLWGLFDALKRLPVLALRGSLSDILSAATLEAMCRRHPSCAGITIANEGHAPLLRDQRCIGAIGAFLAAAESRAPIAGRTFLPAA